MLVYCDSYFPDLWDRDKIVQSSRSIFYGELLSVKHSLASPPPPPRACRVPLDRWLAGLASIYLQCLPFVQVWQKSKQYWAVCGLTFAGCGVLFAKQKASGVLGRGCWFEALNAELNLLMALDHGPTTRLACGSFRALMRLSNVKFLFTSF